MLEALTRRRLLRAALGGLMALGVLPEAALARRNLTPRLSELGVKGAAMRFTGDRPLFVTVAPGVEGRDVAQVLFQLEGKARVRLDAVRTGIGRSAVHWSRDVTLPGGSHRLAWRPAGDTPVGSYVMRLTVEGNGGRRVYGGRRPASPDRANAPVVRVLGVEAAFTQRSYRSEERMALRVLADAPSFTLTFLRVGHGPDPSQRSDEMTGLPMGDPITVDWTGKRSTRQTITVQSGVGWPSGLYTAKLETPDGRVGFAPFVIRPTRRATAASRSSCRRTPGRRTTSTTPTATAGATRGTRAGTPPSSSTGRIATGASRRASSVTTSRSSDGSRRRGGARTCTPTTTSRRSRPETTCGSSTTSSSSRATPST